MRRLRALLWDVDGTLAETERDAHRVAFNLAFEACALPWRWDVDLYGRLLRVAGGRERLMHFFSQVPDAPASPVEREALAARLHPVKNRYYGELVTSGQVPLREGVRSLMDECRAEGVALAIATTTSRDNVAALLGTHLGPQWASWFAAVVCGEDVARKKPDPEVYVRALERLGVAPGDALAIEDSPDGTTAAVRASLPVVVTRSVYFATADISGATAIGPGLDTREGWAPACTAASRSGIGLADLEAWRAGAVRA